MGVAARGGKSVEKARREVSIVRRKGEQMMAELAGESEEIKDGYRCGIELAWDWPSCR